MRVEPSSRPGERLTCPRERSSSPGLDWSQCEPTVHGRYRRIWFQSSNRRTVDSNTATAARVTGQVPKLLSLVVLLGWAAVITGIVLLFVLCDYSAQPCGRWNRRAGLRISISHSARLAPARLLGLPKTFMSLLHLDATSRPAYW